MELHELPGVVEDRRAGVVARRQPCRDIAFDIELTLGRRPLLYYWIVPDGSLYK